MSDRRRREARRRRAFGYDLPDTKVKLLIQSDGWMLLMYPKIQIGRKIKILNLKKKQLNLHGLSR